MKFGLIVSNRSFFPAHLVREARKQVLDRLEKLGYGVVAPGENDTPLGAVMTYADAKACAALFQRHAEEIDGILVILPNFGTEAAVADTIARSGLHVPVLVQACDDDFDHLEIANRRDAFCGKISVCNNLYQQGIPFTGTATHTCSLASEQFAADLRRFAAVCRVVRGLAGARIGAIGARPDAFRTVRFSERLLQASGITVVTVDMSDIIARAAAIPDSEPRVAAKIDEIHAYGRVAPGISQEKLQRQAKLCLTLEQWVAENDCDCSAVQCWDSIQYHYGCATCLAMSMMGEKGRPSACEMDVTGALTMYALYLASGEPSGYLDWNNNYKEERDKCICLHCSNFPKSFFRTEFEIENLDVLATTIGAEKCFGACKAQVAAGPMTYAKITTDDRSGCVKAYVGEGEILPDRVSTKGGVALCRIPQLQELMRYITHNGFEHHVAMSRSRCAGILEEALGNYMGWQVSRR